MNAAARKIIASAIDLPCWQVRWDNQVGLDLNLGPPSMVLEDRAPHRNASPGSRGSVPHRHVYLKGSHWLCVTPGFWRIELAEGLKVRATSSAKAQDMACARLKGERLKSVRIDARTSHTVFSFDLGGVISVSARGELEDEYDELWTLHGPGRVAVSIHAKGHYRVGSTRSIDASKRSIKLLSNEQAAVVIGQRRPSAV